MREHRDTTSDRRVTGAGGRARAWRCGALLIAASLPSAHAHELWLDPAVRQAGDGGAALITADVRNGEGFAGERLILDPSRIRHLQLRGGEKPRSVGGGPGGLPAVVAEVPSPGVYSIAYVSTPTTLRYARLGDFVRFAEEEGAPWVVDAHRARGLPRRGFVEAYSRYAKTVVATGDDPARDGGCAAARVELGLELELTPLGEARCFGLVAGGDGEGRPTLALALRYRGEALPDMQVSLFHRAGAGTDAVERRLLQSDADGVVRIRDAAPGDYLVNAVLIREPSTVLVRVTGAAWESLWASITFTLPPPPRTGSDDADPPPRAARP